MNKFKSEHMRSILFFIFLFGSIYSSGQCWRKISAGDYNTLAINLDVELWAWGDKYTGELGDGTTIN